MAVIVQKFGGTSVANTSRIKEVSKFLRYELDRGNQVIIVVSAMAGVTNQLVTFCNELSRLNSDQALAEYDSVLASGEIVTAGLLALRLAEDKIPARSFSAWQVPIITDVSHTKAMVSSIDSVTLIDCLKQGITPVITGFQGVTKEERITTLGRGGSDTTAMLIAAAMNAERCDIYTDVEGVFTADPRVVHQAKKINSLSFEEMRELAASGAKVLHPRCVEVGLRYKVPIRVLSSFLSPQEADASSTLITNIQRDIMEHRVITAIASNKNLLKILINYQKATDFAKIMRVLTAENIHIEHIIHNNGSEFSFIVPLSEKNKLELLLDTLQREISFMQVQLDTKISLISMIGYGIKNDTKFIGFIIELLDKEGIELQMMHISEVKISLLINDEFTEKFIKLLHEFCEIGKY